MTYQDIVKLFASYDELHKLQDLMSENIKTAQDRFNHVEIELEREGKKVKIPQKMLWQEVFHLGVDCQAGKALKDLYPIVFELKDKEIAKVGEIKEMEVKIFGFDHQSMSLPNIIKLVISLIEVYAKSGSENLSRSKKKS